MYEIKYFEEDPRMKFDLLDPNNTIDDLKIQVGASTPAALSPTML